MKKMAETLEPDFKTLKSILKSNHLILVYKAANWIRLLLDINELYRAKFETLEFKTLFSNIILKIQKHSYVKSYILEDISDKHQEDLPDLTALRDSF